jgi:DNA-binding NarL/FixJ family response regulator
VLLGGRDAGAAAKLATASAEAFAAIGAPFDRARALLVAGNALRRLGERRQAAQPLAQAVDIFARLGAALWLRQAEDESLRASPRRRHDHTLTAAEMRVAALVAAGRKNRQIAAELYTSESTVEAHLTRIYRKLGVRSRTELVHRLAEGR